MSTALSTQKGAADVYKKYIWFEFKPFFQFINILTDLHRDKWIKTLTILLTKNRLTYWQTCIKIKGPKYWQTCIQINGPINIDCRQLHIQINGLAYTQTYIQVNGLACIGRITYDRVHDNSSDFWPKSKILKVKLLNK